jgi:cytochrome subunit of sulfide dehydrogenase
MLDFNDAAVPFCRDYYSSSGESALAASAPATVSDCAECHGDHGVSTHKDVPTIAGMSDFYLEGQMQAYQKAQRPCPKSAVSKTPTDMCEVSKKLDQAQIKEIGAYYAAQAWVAAPQQGLDAAKLATGKSIHAGACEICHTKGGSVADDDAGILAGQWLPYLQLTLQDYKSGKRVMPDKMKPKLAKLSADDLEAVAQFYASEGPSSK